VFPNPCHDHLNISIGKAGAGKINMVLYNVLGEKIYSSEVNADSEIIIPAEQLSAGLYSICISSENKVLLHQRIVKQ
jgi:hypothetical protein